MEKNIFDIIKVMSRIDMEDVTILLFSLILLGIGVVMLVMKDHVCNQGIKPKYNESTKITGIVLTVLGALAFIMQIRTITRVNPGMLRGGMGMGMGAPGSTPV